MKALFVANNPGSFSAMVSVIKKIPGAKLLLTPTLAPHAKIPHEEIHHDLSPEEIRKILLSFKPQVLVTGNSVPHGLGAELEHHFRLQAKVLKIPTLCILDHWCHYSQRFVLNREDETPLATFPQVICVMDERAKAAMIGEGVDEKIVRVTGQPAFDSLMNEVLPHKELNRKRAREKLGLNSNDQVVGFVSEPIEGDHGMKRGFTEWDVYEGLQTSLKEKPETKLIIKTHPREKNDKYPQPSLPIDPIDFVLACDTVVGVTSILLLQALLLGQRVISYQPGAHQGAESVEIIFPVPVVTTPVQLSSALSLQKNSTPYEYRETRASEKVLEELKKLIL